MMTGPVPIGEESRKPGGAAPWQPKNNEWCLAHVGSHVTLGAPPLQEIVAVSEGSRGKAPPAEAELAGKGLAPRVMVTVPPSESSVPAPVAVKEKGLDPRT